jgi:hypothetical protein
MLQQNNNMIELLREEVNQKLGTNKINRTFSTMKEFNQLRDELISSWEKRKELNQLTKCTIKDLGTIEVPLYIKYTYELIDSSGLSVQLLGKKHRDPIEVDESLDLEEFINE